MNSSTNAVIATAKGEITGLAFPATVEALIAAGPDFLTKAFRITGVLAANNSVVAIDKTTEFFGGAMGRKMDAFCHWVRGCKFDRLGVHASVRDRRLAVTRCGRKDQGADLENGVYRQGLQLAFDLRYHRSGEALPAWPFTKFTQETSEPLLALSARASRPFSS